MKTISSFHLKKNNKQNISKLIHKIPHYVPQQIKALLSTRNSIKKHKRKYNIRYRNENIKTMKWNNNLISRSYNGKFLQFKQVKGLKQQLFLRTIGEQNNDSIHSPKITEQTFKFFLDYRGSQFSLLEAKEMENRARRVFVLPFTPIKNRVLDFTTVHITNSYNNAFTTVFRGPTRDTFDMNVISKTSAGLLGYKGPKKATFFAKKEVIKNTGVSLVNKMTALLDVVFTSKMSKQLQRKSLTELTPNLGYILSINLSYERSHGFQKFVNERRT